MATDRHPHILNASTNILGICFVLITGLKLTGASDNTYADELCIIAALGYMITCLTSYLALRRKTPNVQIENVADFLFVLSTVILFLAVLIFAKGIL